MRGTPSQIASLPEGFEDSFAMGLRKVHAAQQILEARVGAQVIEQWINLQKYHERIPPPVGSLQTTKGFVFLP